MGLLKVLTKEGRWTEHLPPGQRAKADAVLAMGAYERMQDAIAKGKLDPHHPSVTALEIRLHDLLDAAGIEDTIPRIGGGRVNPKTGLTQVEELLGVKKLQEFQRPKKYTFSGKIPGPPPGGYPPTGFRKFLSDLSARAGALREFAAANKKPLMYAGAGAGALGLGLLGLHAATQKRHEELRGKG